MADFDIAAFSDDEVLDLTVDDEDWDDIEVALSCGLADLLFPGGVGLNAQHFPDRTSAILSKT